MEAKSVALDATISETKWLQNFLPIIPFLIKVVTLISKHCDSQVTKIANAKSKKLKMEKRR